MVKMGVAVFALYALSYAFAGKNPGNIPASSSLQKIDWNQHFNFEDYKSKVFPDSTAPMKIIDTTPGEGNGAICGQEADIRFEAFDSNDKRIEGNLKYKMPLTVRIGAQRVVPALEEGLIGMKPGGKRTITAASYKAYGAKGFAKDNPELAREIVRFEIEMLALRPEVAAQPADAFRARAFDRSQARLTDLLSCGDTATFRIAIWKADGTRLYSNMTKEKPYFTIRIGDAQAPRAVEEALIGMSATGHARTVIAPGYLSEPLYPEPVSGEKLEGFSLPANEMVVMDIATFTPQPEKK